MRSTLTLTACLLALAACSSPPKPPTVNEAARRPVNAAIAVELQVCKSELQNTRILANECTRRADVVSATLAQVTAHQQTVAAMVAHAAAAARAAASAPTKEQPPAPTPAPAPDVANRVYTLHFDFGSTQLSLPAGNAAALIAQARAVPLVLLRGRTDGTTDSPAESRIARGRADAVKAFLVNAGVDPARIRATYQPAGDHAADNTSTQGQAANRRVEIELYRARPVAAAITTAATATATP